MKILNCARLARWDLDKVVQLLASRVTKWTVTCDIASHRLVLYINSTVNLVLYGYVGDPRDALGLDLYAMQIGPEIGMPTNLLREPLSSWLDRTRDFHLVPNAPNRQ